MPGPQVRHTRIPGLFEIQLVVNQDERGSFTETYHRSKLAALGLPPLEFVQCNRSCNERAGVTRGIHAEPWDKYITIMAGKVFVAIVDLRPGPSFGWVETLTLTTANALLVPNGCGNSYQTLEPNTVYSYMVTSHWRPDAEYTFVNLFDPDLAIDWPVPREQAILSNKDLNHPPLSELIARMEA